MPYHCLSILRICGLFLAAASATVRATTEESLLTYSEICKITHKFPPLYFEHARVALANVSKVNLSSDDLLRSVIIDRIPKHVSNHTAQLWSALNWDLLQMSKEKWSKLFGILSLPVKRSLACANELELSTFLSHMESDSGNIRHSPISIHSKPQFITQMSMSEFLLNITSLNNTPKSNVASIKRYLYSTEYDMLEEELGLHSATDWTRLLIDESDCTVEGKATCTPSAGPVSPASHPSPLLHLLHPGSVLQARHSQYHTMRVQLQGTARYYLSPPQHSAHPLHVYPTLHQRAGQSQMHLYNPMRDDNDGSCVESKSTSTAAAVTTLFKDISLKLGNNSVNGPMQVTVLQAGEILYIPPFWSVHSEAVSLGVVLDVLSVSLEQQILMPASFITLPFSPDQVRSKEQRIVAAQVLLVHVLSRVRGVSSVKNISEALYHGRFSALYPENGLFMRKRAKFQCLRDQPDLYADVVNKLDAHKVRVVAEFVAGRVNNAHFSIGRPQRGAKWVWLADYIEQIAKWAMGGEEAVLFIRQCLFMDEVLPIIEEVLGPDAIFMNPDEDADET